MKRFYRYFHQHSSGLSALFLSSSLVGSSLTVNGNMVSSCEREQKSKPSKPISTKAKNQIIFLGTGSSTGCPKPLCTMLFNPKGRETFSGTDVVLEEMRERFRDNCHVSNKAIIGNPLHNKDYRNNPSLLIAQYDEKDNRMKHIIIDVGKTFREGSLRFFPEHNINRYESQFEIFSCNCFSIVRLTHMILCILATVWMLSS